MGDPFCIRQANASPALLPLSRWERRGLVLLLLVVLGFGLLVEKRSAFLSRRMGDLDVFLRAAWAVRVGEDLYQASAERFHYHYPPLFAILMTPLADPPTDEEASAVVPYPVSVALWYVLSLVCLAAAVHLLAKALEDASPDPDVRAQRIGCRRWCALRVLPVLACLPPIGHTLMRGQVNLLLLLLLCGLAAAVIRGRLGRSGLWLAGAICLKVIPAFLLLFPLWRRDLRSLTFCALGLLIGLGLIPLGVFGAAQTLAYYREWSTVLVSPGLGTGNDQSRAQELIDATATDSQSFQAIIHNSIYPDGWTRPRTVVPWVRLAHWLLGGVLALITLLAGWKCRDAHGQVMVLGCLVLLMILLSPVCHLHYFCLAIPLIMGLLSTAWKGQGTLFPGKWLSVLLLLLIIANTLPHLQFCQRLRDIGIASHAALLLWLTGVIALWRTSRESSPAV
jgi:hypothetical protein